jgi:hypothetical protein
MLFRFCCDESHEGRQGSECCTISGFFSNIPTWEEVEERWDEINRNYGVPRFHAQHLNRRDTEYEGWCKCKADSYSAELLQAVNEQGRRMRAYNCGMHCDAYTRIISEDGRTKLGDPLMACFNSCVTMIARDMETLPTSDVVEIIVERGGGFNEKAVETFERLKVNQPERKLLGRAVRRASHDSNESGALVFSPFTKRGFPKPVLENRDITGMSG